jgi:hypothetical protein
MVNQLPTLYIFLGMSGHSVNGLIAWDGDKGQVAGFAGFFQ